ncbi:MAG: hypothetical protein Q4C49_11515, partial [Bacillota bacterium]|nr:hypothetical protein [Bacillota bacterium]
FFILLFLFLTVIQLLQPLSLIAYYVQFLIELINTMILAVYIFCHLFALFQSKYKKRVLLLKLIA